MAEKDEGLTVKIRGVVEIVTITRDKSAFQVLD